MSPPEQTTDFASDRVASAPYNFVPLPERVVTAAEHPADLPPHDRYDPQRLSGYFDVHVTTRTPLYVRGALPLEDFLCAEAGVTVEQLQKSDPDATFRDLPGNIPDFFYQSDPDSPVIPGSSLRGMLRAYLSIVSYGKLQPVSERRLSFRSLDKSRVGGKYKNLTNNGDNVKTGFLQKRGSEYKIQPCKAVRVSITGHDLDELYDGDHPTWKPSGENGFRQQATVFVHDTGQRENISPPWANWDKWVNKWAIDDEGAPGCLVLAGAFDDAKRYEHVFIFPDSVADDDRSLLPVEDSLVEDFNSEEQIRRFARKSYPEDEPYEGARRHAGMLRDDLQPRPDEGYHGEPVHYIAKGSGDALRAHSFGRAVLYRIPYERSPRESLPKAHYDPSTYDYAEALFGFVRTEKTERILRAFHDRNGEEKEGENLAAHYEQGGRGRAYAGRVTVTPAATVPGQGDMRMDRAFVPKVLSTPEPTTVQHYLVQTSDAAKELKTYDDAGGYDGTSGGMNTDDDKPETTLRGHKLYWHQGECTLDKLRAPDADELEDDDSQHTYIQPVKSEKRFRFRIRFDNLCKAELGALCWTLHPQGDPDLMRPSGDTATTGDAEALPKRGYFHKLGMGRPLGMGGVQLNATLYLTDRRERYRHLFDVTSAEAGEAGTCRWHVATHCADMDKWGEFLSAFKRDLRKQLDCNGWWIGGPQAALGEQPRIQDLLSLMYWPGYPAEGPTRRDPKRYLRDEHRPNTRYMEIELDGHGNEYRDRPVLPPPATFDDRRDSALVVALSLNPTNAAGSKKRALGRVEHYRNGTGYITNPKGQNLRFNDRDKDKNSDQIDRGALVSFFVTHRGGAARIYRETKASARQLLEAPDGSGLRQAAPDLSGERADPPPVEQPSGQQQRSFDERQFGRVKWFNDEKGFGFITPDEGYVTSENDKGNDVFLHQSNLPQGETVSEGNHLAYDLEKTPKGLKAVDVERV